MLSILFYADTDTINCAKDSLTKLGYEVHSTRDVLTENPRVVYVANEKGLIDPDLADKIRKSYNNAFKFFQKKPIPQDVFCDYDVVGMNFERLDKIVREKIKIRCEIMQVLVDMDRHPNDYPTYR